MKKWQESRNYRQVKNDAGEIISYIITVDGIDVEVPEDVYRAYSQADRRECPQNTMLVEAYIAKYP